MLLAIAVFAPLLGCLICGLLGRLLGDRPSQAITIACMLLASACGAAAWYQHVFAGAGNGTVGLGTWIDAGSFHLDWALRSDTLSVSMVAMVTAIATLIHIYSTGYMAHEADTTTRFFAYLSLFTLRHADAGHGRQPGPAVLRLGRRGFGQLPADRLLV